MHRRGAPGTVTGAELTAIAGCLGALVAPTLTGLPGAIVAAVAVVVEDVAKYLSQVPPGAQSAKALTADQKMKLQSLHVRALDAVKRARAIKH